MKDKTNELAKKITKMFAYINWLSKQFEGANDYEIKGKWVRVFNSKGKLIGTTLLTDKTPQ